MTDNISAPSRVGSQRLFNIQALRGVAALLVALDHCGTFYRHREYGEFFSKSGSEGVLLFFIISGFIMVFTTGSARDGAAEFIRNRVTRVVPLYWFITLVVFFVALVTPSMVKSTHANLLELVESMAFIPFLKESGVVEPIVFVGWSLNYEMFFYGLFAIGLLAKNRRAGVLGVVGVLFVLILVGRWIPASAVAVHFWTQPILMEFALGMLLGTIWQTFPIQTPSPNVARSCLVLSVLVLLVAPEHILQVCDIGFGAASGMIVAAALVLERNGKQLRWQWVQRLGDASYSIYLTHFFVTGAMEKACRHISPGGVGIVAFILVSLVLSGVVGVVVHIWIERPLTAAARRLWVATRRSPLLA